jgi:hypothetical protein
MPKYIFVDSWEFDLRGKVFDFVVNIAKYHNAILVTPDIRLKPLSEEDWLNRLKQYNREKFNGQTIVIYPSPITTLKTLTNPEIFEEILKLDCTFIDVNNSQERNVDDAKAYGEYLFNANYTTVLSMKKNVIRIPENGTTFNRILEDAGEKLEWL